MLEIQVIVSFSIDRSKKSQQFGQKQNPKCNLIKKNVCRSLSMSWSVKTFFIFREIPFPSVISRTKQETTKYSCVEYMIHIQLLVKENLAYHGTHCNYCLWPLFQISNFHEFHWFEKKKLGKQYSFWLVKKFDFKIRETICWAI